VSYYNAGSLKARPRFFLSPVGLCILFAALALTSCVGDSIHGLSEKEWRTALASGTALPIPDGQKPNAKALQKLGPGALLFLSMHAESQGKAELRLELLREALKHESGMYQRRAADLLADALGKAGSTEELLRFARSDGGRLLPPAKRLSIESSALFSLGRGAEALASLDALRSELGGAAAGDTSFVTLAIELGIAAAGAAWPADFRALFALEGNSQTAGPMRRAVAAVRASDAASRQAISEAELLLAEARGLSASRDYGASVLAFRRYAALQGARPASAAPALRLTGEELAALVRALPRPAASDAARAFLYGSSAEGEAGWKLLAEAARGRLLSDEAAFHGLFWQGRFARAAGRWQEAATAFGQAAAFALAPADLDAARWYQIECASRYSAAEAVDALALALASSADPAYYADLIEPLSRSALTARNGGLLARLDYAMAGRATLKDQARVAYITARAADTGLISQAQLNAAFEARNPQSTGLAPSPREYARLNMNRAYRQDADAWYRLLAAYRLGQPLMEPADGSGAPPPPEGAAAPAPGYADASGAEPRPADTPRAPAPPEGAAILAAEDDDYALGLLAFGLESRVRAELGARFRGLGPDTLRAIADSLERKGSFAESIRIIAPLFSREGYTPSRRDRELYWPRPFRDDFLAIAGSYALPEALLYGLARSESLFQPAVVSSAGAIGLAQLMPATAEETAARLRLSSYDLTEPLDNLTLGAAYLKRVMDNLGGRVLPALFSYNAGPTRFRRWEAAAPNYPLDLLLETLEYQETRQYGRNVVGAAAAYAALYGEDDVRKFLAYMLGEG
jgi:soluble lytic murein transglycosylase-like protein